MVYRARLKTRTVLRDTMQDRGIAVRSLADRAGCGKSIIGLLRSGARTSCSPALAVRIAAALDIPAENMFRIEQEGDQPEPSTTVSTGTTSTGDEEQKGDPAG
ncbi:MULTISPECIES: helix-turn-helix transcriptional regulator [unclassified Nocardia]|uniref:helix-turn-helix transcriptional regulator n=1 Tax=unclassified Nocardia TaxID=2637762 RepID=UPI001CE3E026|nr:MULTISPECIES: helix-turn-helix transcriptional regulator [unclassified Nocardia]